MNGVMKQTWDRITAFWINRTLSQRMLLGGLAASVVLSFVMMVFWLNKPDYKVLYSKLGQEDASRVIENLKSAKIIYHIEDNGSTIMVPADIVYEQRLKLAGEGALRGQGIGFEIFDETKVGQTDFVQRINYQRALQGELARTISEYPEIEKVRVHLVLPTKSLFIEEQKKASAAVVITLKNGQKLDQKQVQGIVNFVSMAVEGLDPGHITVTDTTGKALYRPKGETSLEGMTTTQFEFKNSFEGNLQERVEQMLSSVVGPGRSMARISADLDFSQRTTRRELYDPDKTVIRSQQESSESTTGKASMEGATSTGAQGGGAAVPDTNFRGDGYNGTVSKQESTRDNKTTNYEINKEEQNIVSANGELRRLSVAVIVDGTYEKVPGSTDAKFVPRSAEELERIKQVVSKAVGLDPGRGDTIEVSSFSFGGADQFAEPSLAQTMLDYAQRLGKPFLNGLLVFLFLILVVRPVVLALIRPRVTEQETETLERLPESERRIALSEGGEDEAGSGGAAEGLPMLEESKQLELAKNTAQQLFETNVEQALLVLKMWLKQEA